MVEKEGLRGACGGWAEEEGVQYGDVEGGCKVLVSVFGWESVEAHAGMRGFGEDKGVVMGMEGLSGMEVLNVKLVRV